MSQFSINKIDNYEYLNHEMDHLLNIPPEILSLIIEKLDDENVVNFSYVNKYIHHLCCDIAFLRVKDTIGHEPAYHGNNCLWMLSFSVIDVTILEELLKYNSHIASYLMLTHYDKLNEFVSNPVIFDNVKLCYKMSGMSGITDTETLKSYIIKSWGSNSFNVTYPVRIMTYIICHESIKLTDVDIDTIIKYSIYSPTDIIDILLHRYIISTDIIYNSLYKLLYFFDKTHMKPLLDNSYLSFDKYQKLMVKYINTNYSYFAIDMLRNKYRKYDDLLDHKELLNIAFKRRRYKCVKLLLEIGAKPNKLDHIGDALMMGLDTVKLLERYGIYIINNKYSLLYPVKIIDGDHADLMKYYIEHTSGYTNSNMDFLLKYAMMQKSFKIIPYIITLRNITYSTIEISQEILTSYDWIDIIDMFIDNNINFMVRKKENRADNFMKTTVYKGRYKLLNYIFDKGLYSLTDDDIGCELIIQMMNIYIHDYITSSVYYTPGEILDVQGSYIKTIDCLFYKAKKKHWDKLQKPCEHLITYIQNYRDKYDIKFFIDRLLGE